MKKHVRWGMIMIGAGVLGIAGCSESVDIEDAITSKDEIEDQKDAVISNINDILALEAGMQEEFEEDLAENEAELFANQEAQVLSSLEERQALLSDIDDANVTLQVENEMIGNVVQDGDDEALPVEELEDLHAEIAYLHNALSDYIAQYESELDTQATFFNRLGEDDDFEFLTEGIEEINDSQEDIHAQLDNVQDALLSAETAIENVPDEEGDVKDA
ncbi:YkyA family protein [Natribacillus halophilus]|uniref:Cell-wall binding lipoprotein n=1 Tax=Natribacillus halophilus TaxID=549003 RepID=A0A1G8M891_9BACI|nr:YkyA family protein [Natribacillus halophilus]SDI64047.1 hypothetical protein SAMN04488123_10422 [Natribacillus halophilus]